MQRHLFPTLIFTLLIAGLMAYIPAPPGYAQADPPLAFEAVDLNGGSDLMLARARAIDLYAYPVLPDDVGIAARIYARGQALNRNENVLSKVGDCNSVEWTFLHPFGDGQYDLGPYAHLQSTVDHYADSFGLLPQAAHNGLNVHAVLDPIWANPNFCEPGESPLTCEYRLHNASLAVIMFGSNDMVALNSQQFDHNLRRVVVATMQAGVIPVLSTFPRYLTFPERSILFNQIVVRVALDFNLPLINLWLALEPLPNHGIAADNYHLNGPLTRAADFDTPENLRTGWPLRNLVTLQALDFIRREVKAQ